MPFDAVMQLLSHRHLIPSKFFIYVHVLESGLLVVLLINNNDRGSSEASAHTHTRTHTHTDIDCHVPFLHDMTYVSLSLTSSMKKGGVYTFLL
jgi:hypothetical protein